MSSNDPWKRTPGYRTVAAGERLVDTRLRVGNLERRPDAAVGVEWEDADLLDPLKISPEKLEVYYKFDGQKTWPGPKTSGVTYDSYPTPLFLDYSTHARHLYAFQQASVSYYENPPTFGVSGGARPDDGSIQFNLGYYIWTGPFSNNVIGPYARTGFGETPDTGTTQHFYFRWIPSVVPPDGWAPYGAGQAPDIPVISTHYRGFGGSPNSGWCWWLNPFTGSFTYTTPQLGWKAGDLVPNVWTHVVMRLTPVATNTWRREIKLDGVTRVDVTGNASVTAPAYGYGANLSFGGGNGDDLRWNIARCGIDDFALWSGAVGLGEL